MGKAEKKPTQSAPQNERGDHPRERNRHGTFQPSMDDIDPKLQPNDEHIKSEAELSGRKEIGLSISSSLGGIPRKKSHLALWPKEAKKGGPKKHPSNHFRNDLRLSKTSRHRTNQTTEKQDDG